jgi:hypothetical protein
MDFLHKSEIKKLTLEIHVSNKKRIKRIFGIGMLPVVVIIGFLFFVLGNLEILIENEQLDRDDIALMEALKIWQEHEYRHAHQLGSDESNKKSTDYQHEHIHGTPMNHEPGGANFETDHEHDLKVDSDRIELVIEQLEKIKSKVHYELAGTLIGDASNGKPPTEENLLLFNVLTDRKAGMKQLGAKFNSSIQYRIATDYERRKFQGPQSKRNLISFKPEDRHESLNKAIEIFKDISWLLIIVLAAPIWRWFSLGLWRRNRIRKQDKKKVDSPSLAKVYSAKVNLVWRSFAALSDLAIAFALGIIAGTIVGMTNYIWESYQELNAVPDDSSFDLALVVGMPVAMVYWLLRDNINFGFRRSPGKIIFGLCPMTLAGDSFTLKTSAKYSFWLVAFTGLLFISTLGIFESMGYFDVGVIVISVLSPFIWLFLAFKNPGRTLADRFAGVRIVDVRSEEAKLLKSRIISSFSDHKSIFYSSPARNESGSEQSTEVPVKSEIVIE